MSHWMTSGRSRLKARQNRRATANNNSFLTRSAAPHPFLYDERNSALDSTQRPPQPRRGGRSGGLSAGFSAAVDPIMRKAIAADTRPDEIEAAAAITSIHPHPHPHHPENTTHRVRIRNAEEAPYGHIHRKRALLPVGHHPQIQALGPPKKRYTGSMDYPQDPHPHPPAYGAIPHGLPYSSSSSSHPEYSSHSHSAAMSAAYTLLNHDHDHIRSAAHHHHPVVATLHPNPVAPYQDPICVFRLPPDDDANASRTPTSAPPHNMLSLPGVVMQPQPAVTSRTTTPMMMMTTMIGRQPPPVRRFEAAWTSSRRSPLMNHNHNHNHAYSSSTTSSYGRSIMSEPSSYREIGDVEDAFNVPWFPPRIDSSDDSMMNYPSEQPAGYNINMPPYVPPSGHPVSTLTLPMSVQPKNTELPERAPAIDDFEESSMGLPWIRTTGSSSDPLQLQTNDHPQPPHAPPFRAARVVHRMDPPHPHHHPQRSYEPPQSMFPALPYNASFPHPLFVQQHAPRSLSSTPVQTWPETQHHRPMEMEPPHRDNEFMDIHQLPNVVEPSRFDHATTDHSRSIHGVGISRFQRPLHDNTVKAAQALPSDDDDPFMLPVVDPIRDPLTSSFISDQPILQSNDDTVVQSVVDPCCGTWLDTAAPNTTAGVVSIDSTMNRPFGRRMGSACDPADDPMPQNRNAAQQSSNPLPMQQQQQDKENNNQETTSILQRILERKREHMKSQPPRFDSDEKVFINKYPTDHNPITDPNHSTHVRFFKNNEQVDLAGEAIIDRKDDRRPLGESKPQHLQHQHRDKPSSSSDSEDSLDLRGKTNLWE